MKALVVEKSSTMRSVLRRMLSMRGFEVAEAESGSSAWSVLNSLGTADIVLVNWSPSDRDSLEFISKLRHEAANVKMVIMLAPPETGVRELHSALVAGADDYLITPFTSLQMDEKLTQAGLICQRGEYCDWRGLPCQQ
jgi:DNA-binding response OmpR family regulator